MCPTRIAVALVLFVACGAFAQQPRQDQPKLKEPARLDFKSLGAMLADLGAESKVVDKAFHKIRWTTPNWGSPVWVSVSGDTKTVWLYTEFHLRLDHDKAPADAWRKILVKNDEIGPSHFSLDERASRLALRRPVTNSDLTAPQLRKELNAFVETVQNTQDLWRATAFLPAMTPEAEKVLSQLEGKWKLTASTNNGTEVPAEMVGKFRFEFDKNQVRAYVGELEALKATVYLEVLPDRVQFDFVAAEATDVGILKLDGDTLTLCSAVGTPKRPTAFVSTAKSNTLLMVLKREKK